MLFWGETQRPCLRGGMMNPSYVVESFGISDLGLVRSNNEDMFHEMPTHRFFVLADGMGGHNAGEIAAKEVIHHLSSSVCQTFSCDKSASSKAEELSAWLHRAILDANQWVHQLSEQKQELSGMGTTLCCLLLHEDALVYAHVGDSRIYRFRQKLEQLTEDHSSFPRVKKGKNMLTRAIGTSPVVRPEIRTDLVEEGDVYFLCSDGLTDYVSDQEISQILKHQGCIKKAASKLIETAKAKGSSDNITILMIKVLQNAPYLSRQQCNNAH